MSDLIERTARVRLLLETLNDPYPAPRSRLAPDSGPAPSRYVPCETCRREGWVRARGGWMLCLVCDGNGWKRRDGEPAWDAYLELPLIEAADLPRESKGGKPIPPEVYEKMHTWERLVQTYDRHGSYQAIRSALDRLSYARPRQHHLVVAVLVEHEARELAPVAQLALDLGVLAITLDVGKVRVPPWLIEQTAADERRATIEGLAAEGLSAGLIAKRLGLSKRAVQRRLRP